MEGKQHLKSSTQDELKTLLAEMLRELTEINDKLDLIIQELSLSSRQQAVTDKSESQATPQRKSRRREITSMDILKMRPGTLKTYKAVQKLGEATCTQVAKLTGRTHGLESRYLNELERHGILEKKRVVEDGRHYVVYYIPKNDEQQ